NRAQQAVGIRLGVRLSGAKHDAAAGGRRREPAATLQDVPSVNFVHVPRLPCVIARSFRMVAQPGPRAESRRRRAIAAAEYPAPESPSSWAADGQFEPTLPADRSDLPLQLGRSSGSRTVVDSPT